MWLPDKIIVEVDRLATVHYVNVDLTRRWNERKRDGELRLLTGWCWTSRDGSAYRQGFKTATVAYRDAYYALVRNTEAPPLTVPTLRVVASRGRAA